jgi:hypothetical protein
MFRAVLWSSSGCRIVLLQHLVSSPSVNCRIVRRLKAAQKKVKEILKSTNQSNVLQKRQLCVMKSTLSSGVLYGRLQRVMIPDSVIIPPEDEHSTA